MIEFFCKWAGIHIAAGFQIFDTKENFEDYDNFLRNSTHAEVQDYLGGLSFNSLGKTKYAPSSQQVSESQSIDYVFGIDRVVQIEGVVLKPTTNNKFMLTLTIGYLNNGSFEELVNETYNSSIMDKFSTFPDEGGPLLISVVNHTPTGYEEIAENAQAARPFIGWSHIHYSNSYPAYNGVGDCLLYSNECITNDYYFFGIHITHNDPTCSTTTTPSNQCN